MDYAGHLGVPSLAADDTARAFFRNLDATIYQAGWFGQRPGEPLFTSLIDYRRWHGARVLEIGCGLGAITGQLARHHARVTALDVTWTAVSTTARRLELAALPGQPLQGDALHLPFADASFDFVWSWGVLHHASDTAGALREAQRVLRPGGELAVMVYNRASLYHWINLVARFGIGRLALLHSSLQDVRNRFSDGRAIGGSPHVGYFTAGELTRMLDGFDLLELRSFEQKSTLSWPAPARWRAAVERRVPDWLMHLLFSRAGVLLFVRARRR